MLADDLDDDGMDDNWETNNGLDPNNPKDAWADADNDLILNLFEFQVETDPNDESSPAVFELSPAAAAAAALDDMVEEAENSIRIVRLAQGNYDVNVLAVFDQNFKIMIQGGRNDNFTEHDPVLYPTNWDGSNDEALVILVTEDNQVTNSTVILEGVNFMATDYFSLGEPVSLNFNNGYSAIGIYNCTFNSNTFYGLGLGHKAQNDSAQVFIVNTVIGNNSSGGIYTQVANGTKSRWRLFNTTINLFEKLNIFPNPFTDNFTIEIDELIWEEAEIRIYDVLGKCIHTEKRFIEVVI